MKRTDPETMAASLDVLARDIQSGDGVANTCIAEAAQLIREQQARIGELTQALEFVAGHVVLDLPHRHVLVQFGLLEDRLRYGPEGTSLVSAYDAPTPFDLILKAAKAHAK